MTQKTKIIVHVRGFPPLNRYGGPPISVMNLFKQLKNHYEVYIFTNDTEKDANIRHKDLSEGWVDYGYANVFYLKKSQLSKSFISNQILDIEPDIIYINSLFDVKTLFIFGIISSQKKIPLIIAPRGQLLKAALKFKFLRKRIFLSIFRFIYDKKNTFYQATSSEETRSIQKYISPKNKVFELPNIPSNFQSPKDVKDKKKGLLRIIFFSRIHPKKNLQYCIETLMNVKCNVEFDVYGYIEDTSYWMKIDLLSKKLPRNIKFRYIGEYQHSDLSIFLNEYDLFFFPSLSENYGHVIAESLENLVPVLTSDNTSWKADMDMNYIWTYPLEKKKLFISKIEDLCMLSQYEYHDIQREISSYLKKYNSGLSKYIKMFDEVSNSNG